MSGLSHGRDVGLANSRKSMEMVATGTLATVMVLRPISLLRVSLLRVSVHHASLSNGAFKIGFIPDPLHGCE